MAIRSYSKSNIFDARKAGSRKEMVIAPKGEHRGEMVEVRYTSMPFQKWVKSNGNVVTIPLANSSSHVRPLPNVREDMEAQMRSQGAIPYGVCPLADHKTREKVPADIFPPELGGACEPGTFGERRACVHVEHLVELWQERARRRQAEIDEKRKSAEEKRLELERIHLAEQARHNRELEERLAAAVDVKGRARREAIQPG